MTAHSGSREAWDRGRDQDRPPRQARADAASAVEVRADDHVAPTDLAPERRRGLRGIADSVLAAIRRLLRAGDAPVAGQEPPLVIVGPGGDFRTEHRPCARCKGLFTSVAGSLGAHCWQCLDRHGSACGEVGIGHWRFEIDDSSGDLLVLTNDEPDAIAIVPYGGHRYLKRQTSHARLIAAAPELLAVCMKLSGRYPEDMGVHDWEPEVIALVEHARAAVNRAVHGEVRHGG